MSTPDNSLYTETKEPIPQLTEAELTAARRARGADNMADWRSMPERTNKRGETAEQEARRVRETVEFYTTSGR